MHWTHGDWGICWYFLFVGITFIVLFTQILVRVRVRPGPPHRCAAPPLPVLVLTCFVLLLLVLQREAREARRARRAKEALEGDEGKPAATNGHSHSNGLRRRH